MFLYRKYATATHIYFPIVKRGLVDFAVGADWTPAAGDVKISIDGAAAANVTNLPTAIAMGNTAYWDISLTTGELTGKKIVITIADAATKAVEDQAMYIETYGSASAEIPFDLSTSTIVASSVTAVGSGAITSSSFAASAINAAAIATDAIANAKIADNAITASKIATDAIATAKIADGAITAAKIADGAIDWATFAADVLPKLAVASYGVLDAGAAGSFTLPTGQRLNVAIGDAFYVPGKGSRVIATYNSSTGVGTTASNGDSAYATSDAYVVFKLPKAEQLTSLDFADGFLTAAKIATDAIDADALAADAVAEIQNGLATPTNITAGTITTVSNVPAVALTSGERATLAAAILDLADAVETGLTPRQALRLVAAAVGGKLSGAGTATEVFRNAVADTKARITATVDSSGNRSAITTDLT